MEEQKTLRKRMMDVLLNGPCTIRDLSVALEIPEKEVVEHLAHVVKSVKEHYHFKIEPPICNKCDYVFVGRKRLDKPSRCPKCRSEYISTPLYWLEEK